MSVRYDAKRDRWIADYVDAFGVRRVPSFKKEAEAKVHEAKHGILARKRVAGLDPSITFGALVDDWLDTCSVRLEPQTVDRYRAIARDHFRAWEKRPAIDVGKEDVRRLMMTKIKEGYRRGTIALWLAALSGLFAHAIDRGLLEVSPIRGLAKSLGIIIGNPRKKAKAGVRVKAHHAPELAAILKHTQHAAFARTEKFTHSHHIAACLMSWCGLRQGETIAFRLDQQVGDAIDVCRTVVRLYGVKEYPKDGESRMVPCPGELGQLIARLRADREAAGILSPWLFPEMADPRPSTVGRIQGQLDRLIRKAGKAAGVKATCHTLRHTFATQVLQSGTSAATLQSWMGHESIETTVGIYGSWMPYKDTGAIAALVKATMPA